MSNPSFSITFGPQTPAADREMVLAAVRAHAEDVHEAPAKALDWPTFVAIMGDGGTVAGGAAALIALGTQRWPVVTQLRERGGRFTARLNRPGQPPLDLTTATEEELLAWLLTNQPQA